jgi:hypothetical protein
VKKIRRIWRGGSWRSRTMTKIVFSAYLIFVVLSICNMEQFFQINNLSVIDNLVGQPSPGNPRVACILITASQMPSHDMINYMIFFFFQVLILLIMQIHCLIKLISHRRRRRR